MAESSKLELLSETRLDTQPYSGLLTCNPSIQLFAQAAGANFLEIRRSNGQVVLKSSQRGERESVQALRWKTDGEFLAVGWSDGVVRLMGLENGKAVHQIPVCGTEKANITCIGWARNQAGKRHTPGGGAAWKDISHHGLELGEKVSKIDLPSALTFLEVESALPKLSPLPVSGGSGDDMYIFTTRASLEFLFRPFTSETSDLVDIMLVGTNDGKIHVSIYDSFIIGTFQLSLPGDLTSNDALCLVDHASHPGLSTHSLLFRPLSEAKTNELFVVPMDLTFIYSSPENLSLLASKTTTLQKLLRYVNQVQTHMAYEWQSTRELPHKFLNSINAALREAGNYGTMDIGQAMYHLVVTGHTFPEVKEWLVDQLAERGHKRWDKAVVSGLESLRSLVHENFLPALERILIILSRLLGIARFHESEDGIGFNSTQITKVMDSVSCLMLVGQKVLLLVMEELELFHAFSTWLRFEIDRLASSSASDELTEKEATMEHAKVLLYLERYIRESPLRFHLSKVSPGDLERDLKLAEDGTFLLDVLDKQIKSQDIGQPQTGVFSQVEFLGANLLSKANVVFNGIAEAEQRTVRFGQITKLELQNNVSKLDIKMCSVHNEEGVTGFTYTALTEETVESNIHIFRTETKVVNGISSTVATQHSCLTLGNAKVLDLKFLNQNSLLVLLSNQEELRIIRVPYQSAELGYQEYVSGSPTYPHVLSTEQVISVFPNMIVPSEGGFMPVQMEVNEARSDRGDIPARVCLLGSDLQTYKVFALPKGLD
ncbi:anaphase-promoting complex, cyclosome, subunit 4-domain-containing protein [Xylariales sp. PMI_506]|nr:anaphase-promoting complex, cyclosome, subunit 4-domain-containing protein [Xylariales sp. PMI_506]